VGARESERESRVGEEGAAIERDREKKRKK